ncbi:DUF4956 domain-containing protein [Phocaeicola vulgatus]
MRTAQAKKSKFGNVMPVVVVFCNLFCIHFLHKYSFRKVKYLMLRKSDAAKLRVTRIDLVLPSRRAELVGDLQRRTGLTVVRVEVGAMDFLHDTAMLRVYYAADGEDTNTVDQLMKLPKTTE